VLLFSIQVYELQAITAEDPVMLFAAKVALIVCDAITPVNLLVETGPADASSINTFAI
jgi:hypothetical protein